MTVELEIAVDVNDTSPSKSISTDQLLQKIATRSFGAARLGKKFAFNYVHKRNISNAIKRQHHWNHLESTTLKS